MESLTQKYFEFLEKESIMRGLYFLKIFILCQQKQNHKHRMLMQKQ